MNIYKEKSEMFNLVSLGLRDLALAIAIGTFIFLPFYAFNEVYIATQIESAFSVLPENDLTLETWYHENGLRDAKIERHENKLTITYKKWLMENPNSGWVFPSPEKLAALGYTQQANLKFSDEFAPSFNISSFIPILIICSQTGFLLIGLWRMRRLKRELGPNKAAGTSLPFKLFVGIFAGVGIVLIGLAYDLLIRNLFGFQADISGIWSETKRFSPESKIIIVFAGVIIAPICEEVFFRGALFKSFKDNGYAAFGVLFSSLMFAAVHFDAYSFPIYFIFGTALAYTYLKTNSLTPAIIAHAINNIVAFYLIYA